MLQKQHPLIDQAEKLLRHNRQGSYKTRERYAKAFRRFLQYVIEAYHLQKLANLSGKHLESYIEYMQYKNLSPATIKTDLSAIRFWHDQVPSARYRLPGNNAFNLERRKYRGIDRSWSQAEFEWMLDVCCKADREDFAGCLIILTHQLIENLQEFIRENRDTVKEKGSTRRLTFHGLRHTYAAKRYLQFIRNAKAPYEARLGVSHLLGHERDDVTQTYLGGIRNDDKPNSFWADFEE